MNKNVVSMMAAVTITALVFAATETSPMDDLTLKKRLYSQFGVSSYRPEITTRFVSVNEIPLEQMARVLEDMVRDGLATLEAKNVEGKEHVSTRSLEGAIYHLRNFHSIHTASLLENIILREESDPLLQKASIGLSALLTYVDITGTKSLPFIQENFVKGRVTEYTRCYLYKNLRYVIPRLIGENKNDDVEQFYSFMIDMTQAEESFNLAQKTLDELLCEFVDGYEYSIQREKVVRKFLNSANELERIHCREIQSQIDKISSDKRVDLSQRFKVAEVQKEPKAAETPLTP